MAPKPVRTKKAVAPGTTSMVRRGLEVEVSSIKATQIKASQPGESDGPGVIVALRIRNETGKRVDLDNAAVSLTGTASMLADSIIGPPADPWAGRLPNGASARAVYVFSTDAGRGSRVSVNVAFGEDDAVAVTTGTVR